MLFFAKKIKFNKKILKEIEDDYISNTNNINSNRIRERFVLESKNPESLYVKDFCKISSYISDRINTHIFKINESTKEIIIESLFSIYQYMKENKYVNNFNDFKEKIINLKHVSMGAEIFDSNQNGLYRGSVLHIDTIFLNSNLNEKELKLTTIHELLHLVTQKGLENNQLIGRNINEMTVEGLAIKIGKEYFDINLNNEYINTLLDKEENQIDKITTYQHGMSYREMENYKKIFDYIFKNKLEDSCFKQKSIDLLFEDIKEIKSIKKSLNIFFEKYGESLFSSNYPNKKENYYSKHFIKEKEFSEMRQAFKDLTIEYIKNSNLSEDEYKEFRKILIDTKIYSKREGVNLNEELAKELDKVYSKYNEFDL